jgi:hypothetical protein
MLHYRAGRHYLACVYLLHYHGATMKAEIKFSTEDYHDEQELRKIANYNSAYLALYKIREHVASGKPGDLLTEIDSILEDANVILNNDVR